MIPEFDQFPIFYFTNHNDILGPTDDILCMPDHMQKLDFELEAAIVIGKKGKNIKAENADDYIAGYLIMNDMSARALQMEEMRLNLGPAKGKDFCTIIGPYLVTKEELADKKTATADGHNGDTYSLNMKCWLNGKLLSEGYIAIQAESHAIDFKNIELLNLCGCMDKKAKNYKTYFIKEDNSLCKY